MKHVFPSMSLGTRIRKFLKFFSPLPLGELPRQSGGLGGEGKKKLQNKDNTVVYLTI